MQNRITLKGEQKSDQTGIIISQSLRGEKSHSFQIVELIIDCYIRMRFAAA